MRRRNVCIKLLVRGETDLQIKMCQLERQHYIAKLDQRVTYSGTTGEEGGHIEGSKSP